jgi:glycosyltransferase involved in cell wall biosynthesis
MTSIGYKMLRLAMKENADIYHFHDPELMVIGLLLKVWGKKVIWDAHEHYPNSILDKYWLPKGLRYAMSKLFDVFERLLLPFFDCVIYTTPIVGQRYRTRHIQSEQICNFPISEYFTVSQKNPQKKVIYLGGMAKIRGTLELLEAFGIVVKKFPQWKLCLVGGANPASFDQQLRDLICSLYLEEKVELIPWVPYQDKERLSSQARIGIITYLPYSNNVSGLPNKLFEYMSVGLPVIASNFPLYKQVVDGNKCGLTVDPSEPQQIAEAIEYLIERPEEAREMGENGRKAVIEEYNWEKESEKLLHVYEEILKT